MNYYDLQKNGYGACEGVRGCLPIPNQSGPIICPNPYRVGVITNLSIRPFRWHFSQQVEDSDSKARAELPDILLKKESYEEDYAHLLVSSPPYFLGSPPVRCGNPMINDPRFKGEEHTPMSCISPPFCLLSPTSATSKAGCARTKYGPKPAAVRIEGFDCGSRDGKNSSIPSVA